MDRPRPRPAGPGRRARPAAARAAIARASRRRAGAAAPAASSPTTSSSSATRARSRSTTAIAEARSSGMTPEQVLLADAGDHQRPARARDGRALRARPPRPERVRDRSRRDQPDPQPGGQALRGDPGRLRRRRDAAGRDVRPDQRARGRRHLDHDRPRRAARGRLARRTSSRRDRTRRKLDSSIAEAIEEDEEEGLAAGEITEIRESAGDAPVIKLVNGVIAQAVEEGASDIHFEPEGKDMRVRYRVDGMLHDATTVPRRMVAGVTSRLKIMASLDIAEKRAPAGRPRRPDRSAATRSTSAWPRCPRCKGEKIVLRLLDKEQALIGLDQLGMQDDTLERFRNSFSRSYGATLRDRPDRLGQDDEPLRGAQRDQLAGAQHHHDRGPGRVPDPGPHAGPGEPQGRASRSAAGLRSIVRSDPDVIMVGEIRDNETAQIAIESALTGHLVLSTLHTNDAPAAISRLTEMGIEPFLTASAIDCVVSQRLARLLCTQLQGAGDHPRRRAAAIDFGVDQDVEAYEAKRLHALRLLRLQGPRRPLRGDDGDRRDPRARDRARAPRTRSATSRSSRACARSSRTASTRSAWASPRSRRSQELRVRRWLPIRDVKGGTADGPPEKEALTQWNRFRRHPDGDDQARRLGPAHRGRVAAAGARARRASARSTTRR